MLNNDYKEHADTHEEEGIFQPNLVMNFDRSELPIYKTAIEKYGDGTLYITRDAYDYQGNRIKGYFALRSDVDKSRADFFDLLQEVREMYYEHIWHIAMAQTKRRMACNG